MKPLLCGIVLLALGGCSPGKSGGETYLQASCEALVSAESNRRIDEVKALETRNDPTGSVTTVSVAGSSAPWLCEADPSGVILGVVPG